MRHIHNIAPRVTSYPFGSAPPSVDHGWIALPQLPQAPGRPRVFGDGSHASTRLCAAAIDLLCRQRQTEAVLDVGTGTGVLARIARARGARSIVATEIDPVALSCAKAHADLDAHPVQIHFTSEAPDHWGSRFDLVVANILEEPLRILAPALCRTLLPGGILLLSGFTRLQVPALRVLYENAGLSLFRCSSLDGWALLTFTSKQGVHPPVLELQSWTVACGSYRRIQATRCASRKTTTAIESFTPRMIERLRLPCRNSPER
jgi:ribosomal protein L11 methyltransferase